MDSTFFSFILLYVFKVWASLTQFFLRGPMAAALQAYAPRRTIQSQVRNSHCTVSWYEEGILGSSCPPLRHSCYIACTCDLALLTSTSCFFLLTFFSVLLLFFSWALKFLIIFLSNPQIGRERKLSSSCCPNRSSHKTRHDSFFSLHNTPLSTTESLLLRLKNEEIGKRRESKAIEGSLPTNCEPTMHNSDNCTFIFPCTLTECLQVNNTRSATFWLFLRATWQFYLKCKGI